VSYTVAGLESEVGNDTAVVTFTDGTNRLIVARQRLIEPLQVLQRNATTTEGIRIVGLKRERLIITRQCPLEPSQLLQRNAAVVEGLRKIGLKRERFVKASHSLLEPLKFLQRIAAAVMRGDSLVTDPILVVLTVSDTALQ
jgi:hypothetical protein